MPGCSPGLRRDAFTLRVSSGWLPLAGHGRMVSPEASTLKANLSHLGQTRALRPSFGLSFQVDDCLG